MRAGPERSEEPRPGRRFATTSEALASLVIAKREQSQPATGKVDPDDRTGVTHHLATRTGRRIDAHHAPTHLTASFSRCVSRLGSGGRVEPKLQREWPSDPGQMVRHKNLMFPSSQVAPLTCARAVAPAVTTPSRHCSVTSNIRAMVGVSSVDLCTSFDVFGLLAYTINHRSLCTVGRGTGADPQRRAVLSWVYGRRKRQCGLEPYAFARLGVGCAGTRRTGAQLGPHSRYPRPPSRLPRRYVIGRKERCRQFS